MTCLRMDLRKEKMNGFEVVGRDGHHSCFLNDFVFQPVKINSPSAFFSFFFFYIEVVNGSEVPLGLIQQKVYQYSLKSSQE